MNTVAPTPFSTAGISFLNDVVAATQAEDAAFTAKLLQEVCAPTINWISLALMGVDQPAPFTDADFHQIQRMVEIHKARQNAINQLNMEMAAQQSLVLLMHAMIGCLLTMMDTQAAQIRPQFRLSSSLFERFAQMTGTPDLSVMRDRADRYSQARHARNYDRLN